MSLRCAFQWTFVVCLVVPMAGCVALDSEGTSRRPWWNPFSRKTEETQEVSDAPEGDHHAPPQVDPASPHASLRDGGYRTKESDGLSRFLDSPERRQIERNLGIE